MSRASRRVIIQADILKAAKILAGDVLALSQADKASEQQKVGVFRDQPYRSPSPCPGDPYTM